MTSRHSILHARPLRSLLVVLMTSSMLAGCATSGGQSTGGGALAGGTLGAIAGGVIGKQIGGTEGAVIGALLGGTLGAMIGDAIENDEIKRQQQAALASGRGSSRRVTNQQNKQVTVRTVVKTVPKTDGSGLSCRQAISYLGDQEAAKNTKCQIRQGGSFDTDV